MRKSLLTFLFVLAFVGGALAQNYHVNENFNSSALPTGWTNSAVSGSTPWSFGLDGANAHAGNNNLDGTAMAYFDDDVLGAASTNNTAHLTTPSFNNSGVPYCKVEFDYNFRQFNGIGDKFSVEVFNGTNWVEAWSVTIDDCGNYLLGTCVNNYPHAVVDITPYINPNCQVRFVYFDGDDWGWYVGLDNVQIYSPFPNDVGVSNLINPVNGCGLGNSESVSVDLTNYGSTNATGFTVSYSVNGGTPTTENFTGTIAPGATVRYNYTGRANMSVVGNYNFAAFTNLSGDGNRNNDTLNSVRSNEPVYTLTYTEGFESGNGGWVASGSNVSWAHGTPNGPFINSAAGGSNAWVTNLTGPYNNNELSYLTSPCLDFSGLLGSPILSFALNHRIEVNKDEFWVEVSTDNGVTWSKVNAAPNSTNWYNNTSKNVWDGNSNAWISVENILNNTAGQNDVKLRFVFDSDGFVNTDGVGIDNVSIRGPQAWDIETRAMIQPVSSNGCGLGANQAIEIELVNKGSNTINNFDAGYIINGGTPVLQNNITPTSPILPNSTYRHLFSTTANMGTPGSYSVVAWAEVANDSFNTNDTLSTQTFTNSAVALPPLINFNGYTNGIINTLPNGWKQGNPSGIIKWSINSGGTPTTGTGPLIDHTQGNATGKYAYIETSTASTTDPALLESPCYNLANLSGAVMTFWYHKFGATQGDLFIDVFHRGIWINGIGVVRGQRQTIQTDPWQEHSVAMNQFAGSSIKVRFRGFRGNDQTGDMAIDDIFIYEPIPQDAKADSLISPESGCDLKPNELVCFNVKNFGTQDILGIKVGYSINNGPPVYDSSSAILIIPGAVYQYCFNLQRANLSAPGYYDFKIWTDLAGDTNTDNDTLYETIVNETRLFPDCEPFTSLANKHPNGTGGDDLINEKGKFYNRWITNQAPFTWETSNVVDHTPAGANQSMLLNAGSGNPGDVATLTSPCYDLTTTAVANLEFWYNMNTSVNNRLYIDVFNGSIWFNSVDSLVGAQLSGWRLKRVSLADYTGNFINIRFRGLQGGGAYRIDDVCVVLPPPNQAQMFSITRPQQDLCYYSDSEYVRVRMRNIGSNSIDSLQVRVKLDTLVGAAYVLYKDTIVWAYPGATPPTWDPGKMYNFDFPVPFDMSGYTSYRFRADLYLNGDLDATDDFKSNYIVVHNDPVRFPYTTGFEELACNATGPNYPNGFKRDDKQYKWKVKCGPDKLGLTGPNKDHTRGNNFGRYFVTDASVGGQGDVAILTTPCMDLSTLNRPVFKFWYHMFGFNMGEIFIDINADNGWVTLDSIFGQQHNNNGSNWTQRSVNLGAYAGDYVKMRFRSRRGSGSSSDMALDDLFLYDLSKYDISPFSLVRPGDDIYSCYSDTQTVKVLLKNFGSDALDFTVDSLNIEVKIDTNGVPFDTMFRMINTNLFLNQFGNYAPLPSDSFLLVEVNNSSDGNGFFDMSHLGRNYSFEVTTSMVRDSVPANDILNKTILTQIAGGQASIDNNWVCNGTSVKLTASNFFGAPKWEHKVYNGSGPTFWVPEFGFGSDSANYQTVPDTTTYYRVRICGSDVVSDSVRVDVTVVKIPDPIHDTICGGGVMTVEAYAAPIYGLQAVRWYENKEDSIPFLVTNTAPFTHTANFSVTDTFYLEGVVDSCRSLGRSAVYAVVNPYPVINLGLLNDTVCQDTNRVLNGGAGFGYKYTWIHFLNGRIIDTTYMQTVGVNATRLHKDSTYSYVVSVTSALGCLTPSDTVNIYIADSCFVGVEELSLDNRLEIFPNPTQDFITIRMDDLEIGRANIEILSIDGKLMHSESRVNLKSRDHRIDLGKLPDGLYYIKINTDNTSIIRKIIKS